MKKIILILIGIFSAIAIIFYIFREKIFSDNPVEQTKTPLGMLEKPLEKYSFDRLRNHTFQSSEIIIGKELKKEPDYTSRMFYYYVDEVAGSPRKKVSGLINIPTKPGTYPIIVMNRGYVPDSQFTTGEGTRRSGELLTQAGYITLAPDYLGFGESDPLVADGLENRYQTYPTAITLLFSLENINNAIESININTVKADATKVGLWGHSNGGHISLAALAITEKAYPTVLWNPVSKPFPYSIFAFMDEQEDNGKGIRKLIAKFEEDYDIEKYSPPNYYQYITAPIQLHQGSIDEAVPKRWSDDFVKSMNAMDKEIEYILYPGDDHYFTYGNYPIFMQRSINYYDKLLK